MEDVTWQEIETEVYTKGYILVYSKVSIAMVIASDEEHLPETGIETG